uniref:Transcriptional regulator n=1 Tax=uncultured prokaryote 2E01B TaxID=363283 RepID=Q2LGQ2_9ZZZZ|nr:conserved hypothetical protein [uncultured prokaryote 2E01B]
MPSNEFAGEHRELIARLLTDEPCLLIDPSATVLSAVAARVVDEPSVLPETRVLAQKPVLKTIRNRLRPATALAQAAADGRLTTRVTDEPAPTTVLATPDRAYALVEGGEGVAALATDATRLVDGVRTASEEQFEAAEPFDFRRPSRAEMLAGLTDRVSEAAAAEFEAAVDGADRIVGLDAAVSLALVVAARNEELLYDLSGWSEDVSLASKATVSRQKSRLVEAGLLGTEKQPIDISRPRLRLVVDDDTLAAVDTADLWPAVRERHPGT